jgi:hypothetical protein
MIRVAAGTYIDIIYTYTAPRIIAQSSLVGGLKHICMMRIAISASETGRHSNSEGICEMLTTRRRIANSFVV